MKKKEIDPQSVHFLDDLQPVPPRNPASAARGRAEFLKQAAVLRTVESEQKEARHKRGNRTFLPGYPRRAHAPVFNALMAVVIAVVAVFGATATTVYAAQDSLPDQSLYPVKTWSEDALLSLTASSQARLNYELSFTDRRLIEMTRLAAAGTPIPERVMTRLQNQLDRILELAADISDDRMTQRLEQVRMRAEAQLQITNALMAGSPSRDQSVLAQAHARIQQQIEFCQMGERDPGGFRQQLQLHLQYRGGSGTGAPGFGNEQTCTSTLSGNEKGFGPGNGSSGTPMPGGNGFGAGMGGRSSNETPGQNGSSTQGKP